MEIGRMCVKIAGRDSGNLCVVVDQLDKNLVLIDGNVRRRKCNIMHLEPLNQVLKIKKNASHSEVESEFKKLKLDAWNTKAKKAAAKPVSKRISEAKTKPAKVKAEKPAKEAKPKAEKKAKKE